MSYSDDTSDQEWRDMQMQIKKESDLSPTPLNKSKYSQKFLEKWLKIFEPWLTRCADDPNKPFCRACLTRLDCNRCHLQRHEKTTKHARNLEILLNKGEGVVPENLSIRQERTKYYRQRESNMNMSTISDDAEFDAIECYAEDSESNENYDFQYEQVETDEHVVKEEQQHINHGSHNFVSKGRKRHNKVLADDEKTVPTKKERLKMFMQIQKDKDNLMESFKELIGSSTNTTQSPQKEKNPVDLFFESVSTSVKALAPKFIAEAKMRVSQLICELELRALNELEAQNHGNSNIISTSSNNDVAN